MNFNSRGSEEKEKTSRSLNGRTIRFVCNLQFVGTSQENLALYFFNHDNKNKFLDLCLV